MAAKEKTRIKKRGDAAVTRAKILKVAGAFFMERGYEGVGLREIALRCGITAAMINRYFGTKEALYTELIGNAFSFKKLIGMERSLFGEKIATLMVQQQHPERADYKNESHLKPMQILLRSAAEDGAPELIQELLDKQLWRPMIAWLGGKNANERAEMIIATMIGFILMHNKIGSPSQSRSNKQHLISLLAKTLQSYVDN